MNKGWKGESRRHSLARRGIRTAYPRMSAMGNNGINEAMIIDSIKEFGLTDDFRVGGYILPDGSMLDFSGRLQGGNTNVRERDHREITIISDELSAGTKGMDEFIDQSHAIRLSFNMGYPYIQMKHPLTSGQKQTLKDVLAISDDIIAMDLEKGLGKSEYWSDSLVFGEGRKKSTEVPINKALFTINQFYLKQ